MFLGKFQAQNNQEMYPCFLFFLHGCMWGRKYPTVLETLGTVVTETSFF